MVADIQSEKEELAELVRDGIPRLKRDTLDWTDVSMSVEICNCQACGGGSYLALKFASGTRTMLARSTVLPGYEKMS